MRAAEVTDAELTLATSYLDGVFPIRLRVDDGHRERARGASCHVRAARRLLRSVPRTTSARSRRADILEAARAHVRPEHLQIVTVGDPSVIRAPLEALALGPVHVYDAEGNPAAV